MSMSPAEQRSQDSIRDQKRGQLYAVTTVMRNETIEEELTKMDALGFEPIEITPLGGVSYRIMLRQKHLNPALRVALELRRLAEGVGSILAILQGQMSDNEDAAAAVPAAAAAVTQSSRSEETALDSVFEPEKRRPDRRSRG